MKKTFLLLLAPLLLAPPGRTPAQDLSAYRNKNRLLVVFASSRADLRWRQDALLAGSGPQFSERDLRRVDVFGTPSGAALRARYGVRPNAFRALLIGKDGHVAYDSPTPIPLSELTGRIDRMPMRRDEMRRKGER